MVSYWILKTQETDEIIGVGSEVKLYELKMFYENFLNTKTRMIKCFGKKMYDNDIKIFFDKSRDIMKSVENERIWQEILYEA